MAIPTWVSAGTYAAEQLTNSMTATLPPGWVQNDIFLLFFETCNQQITAPSGWSVVTQQGSTGGTATGSALQVFWRRANASEADMVFVQNRDHRGAIIHAFRGCPTGVSPINTSVAGSGAATTTMTANGVTTTSDQCLVVTGWSNAADTLDTAWINSDYANSTLTGLTQRSQNSTDLGNGGVLAVHTGGMLTAGATGNTTVTQDATEQIYTFATIALAPASLDSALSSSDTGAGTETQNITAAISGADTGSGTSGQSLIVAINQADSASAVSSQSVNQGATPASGTDTGVGTSGQTLSVSQLRTDTAFASEGFSIAVTLSGSDSGSGMDSQSLVTPPGPLPPGNFADALVLGPACVYIGAYGAPEPTSGSVASTPDPTYWTDIGGLLGGVDILIENEWKTVDFTQVPNQTFRRLTRRRMSAKTEMAEITLANLVRALNDQDAQITAGAGYNEFTPTQDVSEGTPLNYRAVIIQGWAPGFTGSRSKRRSIIMRKCLSIDNVVVNYHKDDQSTFTVTWSVHYAGEGIAPFRVTDEA